MKKVQDNNRNSPTVKFIAVEEGMASVNRWMDLNDELFRRLAKDDSFDRATKDVVKNYSGTLKRLAKDTSSE